MRIGISVTVVFIFISNALQAQTGNIGVGTTNPQAQLHTTGTVRLDILGRAGGQLIRPVYVNDSGMLVTSGTMYSNNTSSGIPIANCTGTSSSITIANFPVAISSSAIKVRVNISHPSVQKLFVYLISPANEVLNLAYENGSSTNNFTNTIFSDLAPQYLTAGTSPFTGSFKPTGNTNTVSNASIHSGVPPIVNCTYAGTITQFADFGGGNIVPNGTWTLKVISGYPNGSGSLNYWSIKFDNSEGFDAVPISPGYLPKGSAEGFGFANSSIYDNGNVGIGTASPAQKLDVAGNINGAIISGSKITTPALGTFSSNMVAAAFGTYNGGTGFLISSGNFGVTPSGFTGEYIISFTGSLASVSLDYATILITLRNGYGIAMWTPNGVGSIKVYTQRLNGTNFEPFNQDFSIAVFR